MAEGKAQYDRYDSITWAYVEKRARARDEVSMALRNAVQMLALEFNVEVEVAFEMVTWKGGLLPSGGCLFGSPGGPVFGSTGGEVNG